MTTPYDQAFFSQMDDWAAASAAVIVPHLLTIISPRSLIDVGGGTGAWTAAFATYGVQDCLCVDGDYVDRTSLRVPAEQFKEVDLGKPFDVNRRFDLAVCLEVAEHLDAEVADQLVDSLVRHSDTVLFSAAIPHQGGTHHVNEQWPDYWAAKFAARGFRCFDAVRWSVWSSKQVSWWYKQNTLLYLNDAALNAASRRAQLMAMETPTPRNVVHPDVYLATVNTFSGIHSLRDIPRLPQAAKSLIRSANASLRHHAKKLFG